jgi:hypothetical protein
VRGKRKKRKEIVGKQDQELAQRKAGQKSQLFDGMTRQKRERHPGDAIRLRLDSKAKIRKYNCISNAIAYRIPLLIS